jgi:8-amino-7-oxononanoate synthase
MSDDWLRSQLEGLKASDSFRDPADSMVRAQLEADPGPPVIDACSNDYLGLGARTVSRETFDWIAGSTLGAGASRLVQGTHAAHRQVEEALASWVQLPSALLGSSAFAVNAGTIPAIVATDSLVISDRLNHASIVDGCRLAKANVVVIPHLDLDAIESALRQRSGRAPAWVVTEGMFSMDGDSPDLAQLRGLCDRYDAGLYVDEAHSLGVVGPAGAGVAAQQGVTVDALVAGLGKAVGAQGGFIAGSPILRTWLWNRARAFVFSTAPSPVLARLTLWQIDAAQRADEARSRLAERSSELREALSRLGLPAGAGTGPIVPIVLGSNERALRAMQVLREQRILAQAIRPPTVAPGAARLRLTVHADWPDDAVPRITRALEVACAS